MTRSTSLLALLLAVLTADVAEAQIFDRIRDRARETFEREVEERTESAAERAVEALFEAGEDAVRCLFTDPECIRSANEAGQDVVLTDEEGTPVDQTGTPVSEDNAEDAVVRAADVTQANANYDFEPGERVLFEDDFTRDNLGDFPRRLEFVNGNWEIVEWQGRRFLRNTGPRHAAFKVPLPETLPDRFTIEFDAHFPHGNQEIAVSTVEPEGGRINTLQDVNYFFLGNNEAGLGVHGEGVAALQPLDDPFAARVVPVRIMVDDTYTKVFLGQQRVANVPNADLPRSNVLWFENTYFADAEHPMSIGNLRVAAGGRDLYSALEAEGRVVTEGVFFDTGSATLRPESFAVVQEIAAMLQEHPELRVRIEGHTDNEGDPASNQALSEQRARTVQTMLIGLGVAADRLEAAGMGQTQPVASNDTAEGRAQNRRVELVRL